MSTSTLTNPLTLRLLQTIGLTSSNLLAGTSLSIVVITVPHLMQLPPRLLLKEFSSLYKTMKIVAQVSNLITAACYFTLAYATGWKVRGYMFAGALSMSIMPYTVAVLMPTNNKLFALIEREGVLGAPTVGGGKEEEEVVKTEGGETAHQLMDRWGVLNLGRSLLICASAVLGTWTVVNHPV